MHRFAFLNNFSFCFLSPGSSSSQITLCDTGNLNEAPVEKFWVTAECGQKDKSLDLQRGKTLKEKQLLLCLLQGATLHREVKKLRVKERVAERIT